MGMLRLSVLPQRGTDRQTAALHGSPFVLVLELVRQEASHSILYIR